jgi:hypothetical protein
MAILTTERKAQLRWALLALAVAAYIVAVNYPAHEKGTPQQEAQLAKDTQLLLRPKIISKEPVTGFHRIGNGAQVQTASGTFEFIMDHHSCVTTPEGVRDPKNLDYGDSWADDQAKLPIYLVNEDFGAGATYVLEQGGESVDDQCIVTPSGQQK